MNKNVSFVDNPISWVFYVFLFTFERIILAGIGFSSGAAWTIVNWTHGIITFICFHWIKGSPLVEDHDQYGLYTFWEQIDDRIQYTKARKFLTIFPIALFAFACDSSHWDLAYVWLNIAITLVVVVAKLPIMHGVRLFGINS